MHSARGKKTTARQPTEGDNSRSALHFDVSGISRPTAWQFQGLTAKPIILDSVAPSFFSRTKHQRMTSRSRPARMRNHRSIKVALTSVVATL